ncbi:recombinase family protein [Caulobacter segnis]|uniref:Resolvase domain protein n=2 Tax=Caulobacter segnis TaxID=88688 RepID=D5VHI6_CAUST|nr:recombinase family protein [Caulobacter segnis]ADG08844.1 Resolvase domain protein [Caulobacter segnis ATCC 21756]AVQ00685.1 recombinase family protein [Caulobacter segnis]
MKFVGYYRVPPAPGVFFSPAQEERLLLVGCEQVFSDRCLASGVVRPGLERAVEALEPGGVLAAPSLHALGGDLVAVMDVVLKLRARDLHLIIQQPEIDTRENAGFFEACAALAAFNGERAMVRRAETALVAKGAKAGGLKGLKAAVPTEAEDAEDEDED